MKFYFFKTVKDGSRNRLNPLPYQTAADGSPIMQKLNTQVAAGGMKLREAYPIGTVFCSAMCELSARGGTPYYCAGDIYPILEGNMNYEFNLPMPTREMIDAYDAYKQTAKTEAAQSLFSEEDKPAAPKKLSLLDKIRSDKRYKVPEVDRDGFFVRDEDWFLLIRNILTKTATMLTGPSGCGKCLGKDTPVLMYDGSIKMVQDVKVGDKLMGPDSKPRNVLSTTTGREELFRINPVKGDSWVCNKSHILSLERTEHNCNPLLRRVNVPITEYLEWSRNRKAEYKQWRTGVNFPYRPVAVDPYFLGLWLGDGRTDSPTINTADQEIADFVANYANTIGCETTEYKEKSRATSYGIVRSKEEPRNTRTRSEIQKRMDKYNLFGNKHIPEEYLHNCRKTRLAVLAGLIDTDGSKSTVGTYEYVTKLPQLRDDVIYLCRSLGFYAGCSKKIDKGQVYWRVFISGDTFRIPVLLERKKVIRRKHWRNACHTSFSVEPLGVGDYYGFTIDGDHLFLLGDFTVTHNTELVQLVAKKLGLEVCIYNMGTMIDPISGLLGVHRLVQGGSVFDYAKFTQDIQKPCIILLDELSRAPLSCNNILLPCLDSRRELPVDIAGGNGARNIKVHPDCVFIATANIGSEYTGTSQMDRALVDRFFMAEIEYMDVDNETKVLSKRCDIEEKDARIIVETARTVRNLFSKGEVSNTLSTRETLGAGRMVSDGWSVLEAMERNFLPYFEGTKAEGERSVIYKTFLRH